MTYINIASICTREGNLIFPENCSIRSSMREQLTQCAECAHAADLCNKIKRDVTVFNGFCVVSNCNGFETIKQALEKV